VKRGQRVGILNWEFLDQTLMIRAIRNNPKLNGLISPEDSN